MGSTAIINAMLCDGSGTNPTPGAIVFDDQSGLISTLSPSGRVAADRIIDADGLTVTPGFIDTHGHSDISLLAAPEAFSKLSQGITSEIAGNCGLSPFPVSKLNRDHLEGLYEQYHVKLEWQDLPGYIAVLEQRQPGINLAMHCGHNTLRAAIVGYQEQPPTPKQIETMRRTLRESLAHGAAGFSSGLLYVPGKFATPEEMVGLLNELRPSALPYATHLRSEGVRLLEAVDEAIESSLTAGIPRLHVSHLKTSGSDNWHKLEDVMLKFAEAGKRGLTVTADRYPYTEGMTQLSVAMPSPWDNRSDRAITELLEHEAERQNLLEALKDYPQDRWPHIRLAATPHPDFVDYCGLPLPEIAALTGRSCAAICIELLRYNSPATLAAFGGMCQENLCRVLNWDHTTCGSDETARPLDFTLGRSHPRGFGSFPEFFRFLREGGVTTGEIIRRFTSLPATIFNLPRRGRLHPGYHADLTVFDPAKFASHADFRKPHIPAEGVHMVFVNGRIAFADGEVVGRHGMFLKPSVPGAE